MKLKRNLLSCGLSELIERQLENSDIDFGEIADSMVISALEKTCAVVNDKTLSDFAAIEEIIYILHSFNIDTGERHDF